MGQKQVRTTPPSYGPCPVTLLATTPQDRQAEPASRAAHWARKDSGSGLLPAGIEWL